MENNQSFALFRKSSLFFAMNLVLFLASCSSPSPEENTSSEVENSNLVELTQAQFKLGDMQLVEMSTQSFSKTIKANGILDVPPENNATVSAYFGGYVKDIRLLPGQQIAKGQTLFVMENPDYLETQQSYLEAKSQLNYLKLDYERQKELSKENITSQKNYLKAEAEYKMTLARYESLRKKLSLMNINPANVTESTLRSTISVSSPISGYITAVNASKGMFMNPTDVAVSIMNTDHMHVELSIFEQDLAKIKENQTLKFNLQNDGEARFDAQVYLINKAIDPIKRTVKVHCHLKNEMDMKKFTPGMYVEAEIFTTNANLLALPEEAVVNAGNNYFILVLKSSTKKGYVFDKVLVKPGARGNGFVEILNHNQLKSGSKILGKGAFNLIKE